MTGDRKNQCNSQVWDLDVAVFESFLYNSDVPILSRAALCMQYEEMRWQNYSDNVFHFIFRFMRYMTYQRMVKYMKRPCIECGICTIRGKKLTSIGRLMIGGNKWRIWDLPGLVSNHLYFEHMDLVVVLQNIELLIHLQAWPAVLSGKQE